MFKLFALVFAAILALAVAVPEPKPAVVSAYSVPVAYSGYSAPYAYSGYAPSVYAAKPVFGYSAYGGVPVVV